MREYLWLCVTMDKYEFPLCVCDTIQELAEWCGTSVNNIQSSICKVEKHNRRSKYRRVKVNG